MEVRCRQIGDVRREVHCCGADKNCSWSRIKVCLLLKHVPATSTLPTQAQVMKSATFIYILLAVLALSSAAPTSQINTEVELRKSEHFLKKLKKAVKKGAKKVSRGVKKIGDEISKGAKRAGRAIKKVAKKFKVECRLVCRNGECKRSCRIVRK